MTMHLGKVAPGSTLIIPFESFDGDGASITMTGLAVTDIEIYKDGGTTQRASDNGYALLDSDGIDFDGAVGLHGFSIDLSDNSTAEFYAAGGKYWVFVNSVTINSKTVRFLAATFEIGLPNALLDTTIAVYTSTDNFTLNAGSADDDAYNGCILVAYDIATQHQIQIGVVEDYTGSSKTVNLKADPGIFTMVAGDNISILPPALLPIVLGTTLGVETDGDLTKVNTLNGHTAQTGDNYARLGAPAGASIAADLVVIDDFVDGIEADLDNGTDGLGALKALIDTIDGIVDNILTDTGTTLPSTLATIAAYIDTEVGAIKGVTDLLPDSGALSSLSTAAALATVDTVVDGIQTDLSNGTDGLGALKALIDTVDTVVDAIKAVTDLLDAADSEPTGVPAANETPIDKIAYIFMALRNKLTVTDTKKTFFGDDGVAEWEQDLTDDATTYTQTEANAI